MTARSYRLGIANWQSVGQCRWHGCVCAVLKSSAMSTLFATLWTIAHKAFWFTRLLQQEYRRSCPPPRDLPDQGVNPCFLHLLLGCKVGSSNSTPKKPLSFLTLQWNKHMYIDLCLFFKLLEPANLATMPCPSLCLTAPPMPLHDLPSPGIIGVWDSFRDIRGSDSSFSIE